MEEDYQQASQHKTGGAQKKLLSRLFHSLTKQIIDVPADILNQCLLRSQAKQDKPAKEKLAQLDKDEWLTTKFRGQITKRFSRSHSRKEHLVLVRFDDVPKQRFYFPLHEVTEWLVHREDVAKDFSLAESYQLQKEFGVNLTDSTTDQDYVANAIQPQVSDLLVGALVANAGDTQDEHQTTTSRQVAEVAPTPDRPTAEIKPEIPVNKRPPQQGSNRSGRHKFAGGEVVVPDEDELLDDFEDDEPGQGMVTTTLTKQPESSKYRSINDDSPPVKKSPAKVQKRMRSQRGNPSTTAKRKLRKWGSPISAKASKQWGVDVPDKAEDDVEDTVRDDDDTGVGRPQQREVKQSKKGSSYNRQVPVQMIPEASHDEHRKSRKTESKRKPARPRVRKSKQASQPQSGLATPQDQPNATPPAPAAGNDTQQFPQDLNATPYDPVANATTPLDLVITCLQACRDLQRVQGGIEKVYGKAPLRQTRRRRRILQNLQQLADDFMEEEAENLESDGHLGVTKRQLTDRLKLALQQAQILLDNQSKIATPVEPSIGGHGLVGQSTVPSLTLLTGAPSQPSTLGTFGQAGLQHGENSLLVPYLQPDKPNLTSAKSPLGTHLVQPAYYPGLVASAERLPPPNPLPEPMQRHLQSFTEELGAQGRAFNPPQPRGQPRLDGDTARMAVNSASQVQPLQPKGFGPSPMMRQPIAGAVQALGNPPPVAKPPSIVVQGADAGPRQQATSWLGHIPYSGQHVDDRPTGPWRPVMQHMGPGFQADGAPFVTSASSAQQAPSHQPSLGAGFAGSQASGQEQLVVPNRASGTGPGSSDATQHQVPNAAGGQGGVPNVGANHVPGVWQKGPHQPQTVVLESGTLPPTSYPTLSSQQTSESQGAAAVGAIPIPSWESTLPAAPGSYPGPWAKSAPGASQETVVFVKGEINGGQYGPNQAAGSAPHEQPTLAT